MSLNLSRLIVNLIAIYSLSSAVYVTYRLVSRVLTRSVRTALRNAVRGEDGSSSGFRTRSDHRHVRLVQPDARPGEDEHGNREERLQQEAGTTLLREVREAEVSQPYSNDLVD